MTDLKLNDYFQPVNAPVSEPRDYLTAYDVQSTSEQNIIGNYQIRDINFNKAQGGTLILGGSGNGNGVLQIKDSGGTTRITANNTGMTITGGNISIQNSSNGTVLDSLGVVNNTLITQTAITSSSTLNQQIGGTAITPLTGGTISFNLARTSTCLFLFNYVQFGASGTTSFLSVYRINVDGVEQERMYDRLQNSQFTNTGGYHLLSSLAGGAHTFTMTGQADTAGGTVNVSQYKMTYILLGQ